MKKKKRKPQLTDAQVTYLTAFLNNVAGEAGRYADILDPDRVEPAERGTMVRKLDAVMNTASDAAMYLKVCVEKYGGDLS